MHTFCDDYRQEFFWRRPEEGLFVAACAEVVTAPDFTVWNDDPVEWREYQAWRSAAVAAYWEEHGVTVLPVVSFCTGCWRYVQHRSTWAVRGPAKAHEAGWLFELELWAQLARPGRVVVFGRMPDSWPLPCAVERRALVSSKGIKLDAAQKEGDCYGR